MSDVNVPAKRNVGFLLGIGILFFPIVFAWFLLRKGHSVLSRVVGFGWLILCILVIVAAPPAPPSTGSRSVSSAAPAAAPAPAEPLKTYTSTQVAKSYDDNTVAADALFKGKRVKVTGRVTDINTDFRGNPYLVLTGSNQFLGPRFKFDKSSISVMATLKKGVTISVICTGAGDVIKTPMFEDCEMSK